MAPERSRLVRRVTFVLLALTAAAVEIAAVDSRAVAESLGLAAVWVGIAAGLGRLVPAPSDPRRAPPQLVVLLLGGLAAAPFVVEPLRRNWTGDGYPLELRMVFALRNLGLGLAACGGWLLCRRLACVVSLFLTLFAAAMTNHPAVLTVLALYTAAGSVWLTLVYWTGLTGVFVATEREVAVEVRPDRERLPWVAVAVAVGAVGAVVGLVAVGPQRLARTLGEWLPTSGGTGGYDPFARGGVNDGDDEVSGGNPKSTGMTKTDTFLDSPLPSLYDMFNERYGEPFKPREQERAIALDQSTKVLEAAKRPADNLRPNREFPTTRKSPRAPRDPSSRSARAVFEVQGRTPLHVRAAAFDAFDGVAWHEAPPNPHVSAVEKERGSCWMAVRERTPPPVFAGPEAHQFKLTAPEGSLIPTPPHVTRFRVGRVDREDFFAWGQDRVLTFARRTAPSGVVVETECRTVDPRLLGRVEFPSCPLGGRLGYGTVPPGLNPGVAALARSWAGGLPRGWPQISAVVDRLRSEYTFDPAHGAPPDCADPLGHFLLTARRGPDYQFATAAAVLLRVLGYPTRAVSGFYVRPDHYDAETKHTPVVKEDLHFWAEVLLPGGDWLVVEPTPGYEVLGPSPSLADRVLAAVQWVWRHAAELGLAALALGGLWWRRRALLDAAAVTAWRWFPGRTWQQCARRALRLLEWRGRWAGRPRPASQTVPSWLRTALPEPIANDAGLDRLTRMAEWATYAPDLAAPWGEDDVRGVCRCALDTWTLPRWRTAVAAGARTGD
ncbi:MAG TPA: transglutaminase-like domain-containing protein [Gemmataceae bacterium]|jgi:transglutaminase-like putative cysteine protease